MQWNQLSKLCRGPSIGKGPGFGRKIDLSVIVAKSFKIVIMENVIPFCWWWIRVIHVFSFCLLMCSRCTAGLLMCSWCTAGFFLDIGSGSPVLRPCNGLDASGLPTVTFEIGVPWPTCRCTRVQYLDQALIACAFIVACAQLRGWRGKLEEGGF